MTIYPHTPKATLGTKQILEGDELHGLEAFQFLLLKKQTLSSDLFSLGWNVTCLANQMQQKCCVLVPRTGPQVWCFHDVLRPLPPPWEHCRTSMQGWETNEEEPCCLGFPCLGQTTLVNPLSGPQACEQASPRSAEPPSLFPPGLRHISNKSLFFIVCYTEWSLLYTIHLVVLLEYKDKEKGQKTF